MTLLRTLKLCLVSIVLASCARPQNVTPLSAPIVQSQTADKVGLNDVSLLFPLPKSESEFNALIALSDRGGHGVLFPDYLWKNIPGLRSGMRNVDIKPEMRVIGARLDPCFREGAAAETQPCLPQLRFIVQPVLIDEHTRRFVTRDTALHLFYSLSQDEWKSLLAEVQSATQQARNEIIDAPLSVHPVVTREGLEGPTFAKLKAAMLRYSGVGRLWRITFMTVAGGNDSQWTFGGIDIRNGNLSNIPIPGIKKLRQTITSLNSTPIPMESVISPPPQSTDNLHAFAHGEQLLKSDDVTLAGAIASLDKVENPLLNNPGTTDCVSCHLSLTARAWAEDKGLIAQFPSGFAFSSEQNLTDTSEVNKRASVMRAFGYFNDRSAISNRTRFESAAIATSLNN